MEVKDCTAWFILVAPVLILVGDLGMLLWFGTETTITGVVREWSCKSSWPEAVYAVSVILLYVHLFRRWPTP